MTTNVLSFSISKKVALSNCNDNKSINLTASFTGCILLYVRSLQDIPNTKQSEVPKQAQKSKWGKSNVHMYGELKGKCKGLQIILNTFTKNSLKFN